MRTYTSMPVHFYTSLWHKYRPMLLKLMIASAEAPQQYKLYDHEFKALNPKEKTYSFSLKVFQGKPLVSIKNSPIAHDLLYVLDDSKKASELMNANAYDFSLDKHFMLRITRIEVPVAQESAAATVEAE
jgi:hypothetical protein